MKFHYYYLIQDLLGVFLILLGSSFLLSCIRFIKKNNFNFLIFISFIKNIFLLLSGLNFLANEWNIYVWLNSLFLFGLASAAHLTAEIYIKYFK